MLPSFQPSAGTCARLFGILPFQLCRLGTHTLTSVSWAQRPEAHGSDLKVLRDPCPVVVAGTLTACMEAAAVLVGRHPARSEETELSPGVVNNES
jgi:hypothetical protein